MVRSVFRALDFKFGESGTADSASVTSAKRRFYRDTERAEVLVNEMIGEARKLVEQYWPDIEALAERLLIKGRVNFLDTDVGASKGYW